MDEDLPMLPLGHFRTADAYRWLAAIVESSGDAIISFALDGSILSWNSSATRMFGYTADEMIGQPISLLASPDYAAEKAEILARMQRGETVTQLETVRVRKTGAPFGVTLTASPVKADNGVVLGGAIIMQDITERKRAEATLAEQAHLLDLSNDAIIVRDVHNRIISWNRGATELYGWTREEALGQDLHTFLRTEFEAPFEQLIITLQQHDWMEGEVVQVTRDGRRINVASRWALDRDSEGRPGAILTTYNNITERKQVEQERERLLREANHARKEAEAALNVREQFLSIASHELRTPLTSLLGYAQLLRSTSSKQVDLMPRMVERIIAQSHRLNALVEELLDVSRLQHGQFAIKPGPLDVASVMAQVVDDVRATLPPVRPLEVEVDRPNEPVMLWGDGQRLEQVFQNLLSNAVKYSPNGDTIRVQVRQRKTEVEIEVTDQGIGIPEAAQKHLFEPFYRAKNVSGESSGFGLGLHIVHEIVERHGGRIEVESVEGKGSTFRVVLPVQMPAPREQ